MKSYRILSVIFLAFFMLQSNWINAAIENDSIEQKIQFFQNRLMLSDLINYVDSLETEDAAVLLIKAKSQFQLGKKTETEITLREILQKNQENISVISDLANFAEAIGNKELVVEFLNYATNIEPLPAFLMQKGDLTYSLKRYEHSLEIADSVLQQINLSQAVRLKARNLAAMKFTKESAAVLRNYLATDPSELSTLIQLSNLYMAIDSIPQMLVLTDNYLKNFDAANSEVLHLNALANYFSKNYKQAVDQYNKLERMKAPFDQNQNYFAGMSHFFLDENYPSDAIPYFMRADSIVNGGSYAFKYYIAKCYDNMGHWEPALLYFQEAYQLIKPDTVQLVQVLNRIGNFTMRNNRLEKNERLNKTIGYYQQVLDLDNENKFATINSAMAYEGLEDYKNAIRFYRRMLELEPDPEEHSYSKIAKRNLERLEKKLQTPNNSKVK